MRKDVEYFNNYLRDPKRPQLPEHPGNRAAGVRPSPMNESQRGEHFGPPGGFGLVIIISFLLNMFVNLFHILKLVMVLSITVEEEEVMVEVVSEDRHRSIALVTLVEEEAGISDLADEITAEAEAVGK